MLMLKSVNVSFIFIRKVFCSSKWDMECKYFEKDKKKTENESRKAQVQVIKSKNSHLVTSETTCQEN